MKLLFCEIQNFGKLQRVKIEFSDGISVFEKPNGWGKTTFAEFLKCMFYGVADNRNKAIENNERRKYKPWQGGVFGGAVGFLYQNRAYRLERSFGETPAQDTFAVYDGETMRLTTAFGDGKNFGERLFGLDKESFCRTAYFLQDDGEFGGLTGNIKESLMRAFNARGNAAEDGGLDTALRRLNEVEKTLQRRGGKGKIPEIDEKLTKITQAKQELVLLKDDLSIGREQARSLDKNIAATQAKISECDREIGAANARETAQNTQTTEKNPIYENYLCEKERAQKRLDGLKAFFPKDPQTIDLKPLEEKTKRYYDKKREKQNRRALQNGQIGQKGQPQETKPKTVRKTGLGAVCLLLCLAAFFGAVCLWKTSLPFAAILGGAGLLFAVIGAVCLKGKKSVDQSPAPVVFDDGALDRELAELERDLSREFSAFAFESFFDYGAMLEVIYNKRNEYLSELQVLERLKSLYQGGFSLQTSQGGGLLNQQNQPLNQAQGGQAGALKTLYEKRSVFENTLQNLFREKSALAADLDKKERRAEELALTIGEEKELLAEKERLEKKLQAIQAAKAYLNRAHDSLASRYLLPVSQGLQRYLRLFDDRLTVELSASGDPYVKEGGFTRETGHYSRGYRDLFWLCLRLALLDCLYEKEKPFLVFDDPFVNLDLPKTQAAKALLKEVSARYQTLYFTCKTPL
ncbi:MAG: AAA family ATPase [Clostridia bacterium]|nr:AAA family ATPase [Clostridia bacterium]